MHRRSPRMVAPGRVPGEVRTACHGAPRCSGAVPTVCR
ncbi:hypothetical protein GZL_02754 [Streptomyces sp. 769]|nr:hypothetical protein GZL_02754 [Streptomyces sp. 769]